MPLEDIVILVARTMLGLFLSTLLAFVLYMVALVVVLALEDLKATIYTLMVTLAVGVGAGIGGYLGWFRLHLGIRRNLAIMGFAVTVAVVGALLGRVQFGQTFIGAVLAVNLILMAFSIFETIRQQET